MKILAIGDPHGKLPKNLDNIVKKNKIDIIICAGDVPITPEKPWIRKSWKGITQKILKKSYKDIINKLCSYKLPVLILRGNMMKSKTQNKFIKGLMSKHKNITEKRTGKTKVLGQNFVFFDEIKELHLLRRKSNKSKIKSNESREKKLNQMLSELKNPIIISHNPPFGVVDVVQNEFTQNKKKHVGSKILLNAIKKHQPKLVLCGHIHEAKGKAKIGKTPVYNLGSHGSYEIIEVKK